MLKIKLFQNYFVYDLFSYELGLLSLIKTILDAPLKIRGGKTVTYEDQFSGAEMKLTSKGAKADKVEISVPPPEYAGGGDKPVKAISYEFASKAPSFKKLKKGFEKLHEDGDTDVFKFFDMKVQVDDLQEEVTGIFGSFTTGSSGNDVFRLRGGNDYVTATTGNDRIDGGKDFDSVDYGDFGFFGAPDMTVKTKKGALKVDKGAGNGTDTLKKVEGVSLAGGDDTVRSKLKSDVYVDAGSGDDDVRTGKGDDVVFGRGGSDTIRTGKGDDVVVGASGFGGSGDDGVDRVWGEGGSDLFVVDGGFSFGSGYVIIKDFQNGTDFIGLAGTKFAEIDLVKNGKHVDIQQNGRLLARIEDTKKGALDREDFHSEFEPNFLLLDF